MKANVGSELSMPAWPTTKRMNRMPTPSVPKNDAITVAISTSGATTASSRTPRITAITASAIGTISFRSRALAWLKSYWVALPPPSSARTPGPRARTACLIFGMRLNAASL